MSASTAPPGHIDNDQLKQMPALADELAARPHDCVEHSLTRTSSTRPQRRRNIARRWSLPGSRQHQHV